jgi:hypothetical protein
LPANDFERWIAGSPVPPDKRDPEALCDGIGSAIRSGDFEGARAVLTLLAFADPRKARTIYDMIKAVAAGDDRRAILLAVPGA